MLKGQVFKEQIFENQIFAVFINTFLNGKNGIINGYKNSMAVTAGTNSITVQSGVICIQGRFLEEDTYTTINTTSETAYCSLVVEINLDNINTDIDFTQGYYKILKNANNYPVLIQDDIVNTNSGIYQYELARFKTSLNGISDFVDLRSYIDYDSLYKEIENKLQEVENESYYLPRSEFDEVKNKIKEPFPIGSIYMSMINTNPSQYFGGTWQSIAQGRMLVGVNPNDSDFSGSNKIGGKRKHTLTVNQLPSHKHRIKEYNINTDWEPKLQHRNAGTSKDVYDNYSSTTTSKRISYKDSESTGSNESIDMTNPYLTCYIWQRTA